MAAILYLDVDDEITTAAARIRGSADPKVALVVPPGSRIATSRMNFRLLAREALERNRGLSIVAADPAARAIAGSAGLPVYASVAEFEAAIAPPAPVAPPPPRGHRPDPRGGRRRRGRDGPVVGGRGRARRVPPPSPPRRAPFRRSPAAPEVGAAPARARTRPRPPIPRGRSRRPRRGCRARGGGFARRARRPSRSPRPPDPARSAGGSAVEPPPTEPPADRRATGQIARRGPAGRPRRAERPRRLALGRGGRDRPAARGGPGDRRLPRPAVGDGGRHPEPGAPSDRSTSSFGPIRTRRPSTRPGASSRRPG